MEKENKMGTMGINKLLITMALPMMISMLVQTDIGGLIGHLKEVWILLMK